MIKKMLSILAVCTLLNSIFLIDASALTHITSNDEYESTYNKYLSENKIEAVHNDTVNISMSDVTLSNGANLATYGGKENIAVLNDAQSSLKTMVEIEHTGYYVINLNYTGLIENEKNIKLSLKIDGNTPFFEASSLELQRCYINETNDFHVDDLGNDIRPVQIQTVYWQKTPIYQNNIGTSKPYLFYLTQGNHSIELIAENGGICFSEIEFTYEKDVISYEEYKSKFSGFSAAKSNEIILQGEKADYKSDVSLYPMTDRTNCGTQDYSETATKLNTIGGSNWSKPGQWIEWEFEIKEKGLYRFDLRVRQNENRGMKCYRTVKINGEIPFSELMAYGFEYNRSWYIETLKDSKTGEAFEFYFEPGKYTFRLEATTGELNKPLEEVNSIVTELNELYHSIIMITGTSPDIYRDYNLAKSIPNLVSDMNSLADRLDNQMKSIKSITSDSATQAVSLTTLADQLRELAQRPKTISDRLSNFYSNISAVSAWANSAFNQPLELDYFRVSPSDSKELKANPGFFKQLKSIILQFIASFTVDYNAIGGANEKSDIVVWTTAGREQAEALKQLIDRDFTPKENVNVDLKLVQSGLVEAVVAGTGPDVALAIGMYQPVDYASRKILEPLDGFDGFDEFISTNFYENSMIPFEFKDHYYALPMTQEFNVMFYRKDILESLNLYVPDTWDELKEMMPILARNNMQIGVPSLSSSSGGTVNTSFPQMFLTMFMQNNVSIYNDDLTKTNLGSKNAIKAFESLTDMYTKYGLPVYFEASNRFRTGEMPIIISTLSTYNALSISAPEIAGRWAMAQIPGTLDENGEINRSVEFSASACVIFKSANKKEDCWKFLKWFLSEQTQYDYGMELEAVLGTSGRYMTANKLAFERLPWDSSTADIIREQWKAASTVPQVPGYYFVSRYLTNAVSDTIVNKENAKVVIERYSDTINSELSRKNEQIDALWSKN